MTPSQPPVPQSGRARGISRLGRLAYRLEHRSIQLRGAIGEILSLAHYTGEAVAAGCKPRRHGSDCTTGTGQLRQLPDLEGLSSRRRSGNGICERNILRKMMAEFPLFEILLACTFAKTLL